MPINDALICAYAFDDSGRAAAIDSRALESRTTDAGWLWIHLNRTNQDDARDCRFVAVPAVSHSVTLGAQHY